MNIHCNGTPRKVSAVSNLCFPEIRRCFCFPCTVLLQHGADPSIRNTDGKSALDLADPSAKAVLTGKKNLPSLKQPVVSVASCLIPFLFCLLLLPCSYIPRTCLRCRYPSVLTLAESWGFYQRMQFLIAP